MNHGHTAIFIRSDVVSAGCNRNILPLNGNILTISKKFTAA